MQLAYGQTFVFILEPNYIKSEIRGEKLRKKERKTERREIVKAKKQEPKMEVNQIIFWGINAFLSILQVMIG